MTTYLVTIYRPNGYDDSTEDAVMARAIDALNDEMKAAGVRVFVGGLRPPDRARSLRTQPDGEVAVTDGVFLQTDMYAGGLWVLEAASLEAAVQWGRKAAVACRAGVEVRPFY